MNKHEPAFRQVPGWPQYEVTNDGVVRSWYLGGTRQQKRKFPHYKKPYLAKDGYVRVTFHEKTKGKKSRVETFSLHRLVAACYLKGDSSLDVAHLDGNKTNNHVSNLRFCTRKENESHKNIHGTKALGSKNGQSKLCERAVKAIRLLAKEHRWTQKKISMLFQIGQANVSAILLMKSWKHLD